MEENLLRSCSPTDGDPPSNGTNTHARPSPDVVLRSGDHSVDQILAELLQDRGWFAFATPSLDDAMSACQATTDFALCVVDERGLEYMVKASRPTISGQTVIMALLTRPTPISAVSALRHGAHVLLPLPVDTALFIAQVEALLRRFQRASLHFFGGFTLERLARRLTLNGREIHLTPTEMTLLMHLLTGPHRVVPYRELKRAGWGGGHVSDNMLHVQIRGLRRKLHEPGPALLETVRGIGYRLRRDTSHTSPVVPAPPPLN